MKKNVKRLYRKSLAVLALFSLELALVTLIFSVSLYIFYLVWRYVIFQGEELEGYTVFDKRVFEWIESWSGPGMTTFMEIVTVLANRNFIIAASVILILYFLFIRKHKWFSMKIPVVALGCITLNIILKEMIGRARPTMPLIEAFGLSFPSGHAMMAFSFYGLLIYISYRSISNKILRYLTCIFLFILIHLIALSRVYLRVHFATDVVAGLALGAAWLFLSLFVLVKVEKFSGRKIEPVL
ncbi:phosphatase PAP2 family protein [Cytophagaceae bacterium ABcell3]|nr:phosphatase PAP2 family protein [Cytophagaceae bacterium ABcell3]